MEIQRSTIVIILGVFAILMVAVSIAVPALALKNYFNCTTKAANKNGKLSAEDINTCYYKVFVGARKYYSNESKTLSLSG
ncbi:MAG TPA: hypothetical protein VH796_05615 [Nitrososphaeraceae archaeon]